MRRPWRRWAGAFGLAADAGWGVVPMKRDWKAVFPFQSGE